MFEKTVLIAGGTSSFGRRILKDILRNSVVEIRILSRDSVCAPLAVDLSLSSIRIKSFKLGRA